MTETNDDFKEEVIELVGDGGDVLKFIHIGTIDYKSEKFVFFQPAVEEGTEEESDEVVVFKISKNGEDDVLLPIEDEKLLDEVFKEFIKIYDESEEA